jgi:hypothetical protein
MTTLQRPITTADLLAMPDDGKRRWVINGELREQGMETGDLAGRAMTIRNRLHSEAMANVTTAVNNWRYALPELRGRVACGEAGVRLPGEPPTTVGVDVAYVPPDVTVEQTDESTVIHGVPTLVVDILSPDDTVEQLDERDAHRVSGRGGAAGVGGGPARPHRHHLPAGGGADPGERPPAVDRR